MQTAEPAKEEKAATADEDSFEMMNDKDDTTTPKKDVAKDSKTEDAPVVKEKKVVEEKKAPSLKKSPPDSKVGNEKKVRDVNQKKKKRYAPSLVNLIVPLYNRLDITSPLSSSSSLHSINLYRTARRGLGSRLLVRRR